MTTRFPSRLLLVVFTLLALAVASGCKRSVTDEKVDEVDESAKELKQAIEKHTAAAAEKIDSERDAAKQSIEEFAETQATAARAAAAQAIDAADKADKAAERARQAAGAAQAAADKLKSK